MRIVVHTQAAVVWQQTVASIVAPTARPLSRELRSPASVAIRSVPAKLIEPLSPGITTGSSSDADIAGAEKENSMSLETILIVLLVVFLLGGGGWYFGRG
jgi:hypothetical protein